MAATIGLSAYTIRLKERNQQSNEWLAFKQGGAVDAHQMIHGILLKLKNKVVDFSGIDDDPSSVSRRVSKAFRIRTLRRSRQKGTIWGLVECGDYGRASTLVNVESGKQTHRKTKDEADMPPYYFRIEVPDDSTVAVLVAQRIGISGLKGILGAAIRRGISSLGYTVKFGTLTPSDLLQAYLTQGQVEEIRVLTHSQPNDPRDAIKHTKINGQKIAAGTKLELSLKRKNGLTGAISAAVGVMTHVKNVRELVEVYGLDNPEEVSVVVEKGGSRRTFKTINPGEIGIKYDITDDVAYDSNNNPKFGSINKIARDWCAELTEQVNSSTNGN